MTELELRQQVCDTINQWLGSTKNSQGHKEILSIYNNYQPLARNYKLLPTDAYCAGTVSATWIKTGIAEYTGTEVSVSNFVQIAKQKNIWIEDDAYIPKIGDAIVYDWEDNGIGDNVGVPDHIGIVTKVGAKNFTVTEGNMSGGKVGQRIVLFNSRYIRGFIAPDYEYIAKQLTKESSVANNYNNNYYVTLGEITNKYYRPTINKLVKKKILQGTGGSGDNLQINLSEEAIRLLVILDRAGVFGE